MASGIGSRHVVRVVGGAVAEHLRVDGGSARPRALELLEHHDARPLAHDEPGPCRVERPGRPRRILVLGDETAHRAEAGKEQRMDARLRTAGQHRVGVAAPHELSSLADGVRAGSAGRDDRVVRPTDTERDGDLAAGRIDEDVGKKRRARHDLARAP